MEWPDGSRSAACATFDLDGDEVWMADIADAYARPGVRSQGEYGLFTGLELVLERLSRFAMTATFFVPGRIAERFPSAVLSIIDAGHEIAHHGYTHRVPATLTPDEEVEEIRAGLEALQAAGVHPKGYRAPAWDVSEQTYGLAHHAGLTYASNLMSDVKPFRHTSGLVELPVHWAMDDAAHFWFSQASWNRKIATLDEAAAIWLAEARGIAQLGGLAIHTFHPQIIGRPGRLALLERVLEDMGEETTWSATAREVAEWADARLSSVDPSVDE